MQRVWSAADPAEAHAVSAALRMNGIAAVVQMELPEAAGGPAVPHAVAAVVWVSEADAERARSLVAHVDARRIASHPPYCEGCGDSR